MKIEFCDNCFHHMQLFYSNKLIYKCNNCGETKEQQEDAVIFQKDLQTDLDTEVYSPQEIIGDLTCPRIKNYKCPNQDCLTNHKDTPSNLGEAVFFEYGNHMRLMYICSICHCMWKDILIPRSESLENPNVVYTEEDKSKEAGLVQEN